MASSGTRCLGWRMFDVVMSTATVVVVVVKADVIYSLGSEVVAMGIR